MNERRKIDTLKDQLCLLVLLGKLKERQFETKRLKLQKLIYLADVFGAIFENKTTSYTFRVYKHGPFSGEIYTDIERLVSLGFAQAQEMEKWTPDQERSFKYDITEHGISKIKQILENAEFQRKEKAIEFTLQAAGYLSGKKIKDLVYSEPNYMKAKKQGFTAIINPDYKFAVRFKQIANTISSVEFDLKLSEPEISWLYLNFMQTLQLKA